MSRYIGKLIFAADKNYDRIHKSIHICLDAESNEEAIEIYNQGYISSEIKEVLKYNSDFLDGVTEFRMTLPVEWSEEYCSYSLRRQLPKNFESNKPAIPVIFNDARIIKRKHFIPEENREDDLFHLTGRRNAHYNSTTMYFDLFRRTFCDKCPLYLIASIKK